MTDVLTRTSAPDIDGVGAALGLIFPKDLADFHSTMSYLRIGGDECFPLEQLGDIAQRLRNGKPRIRNNWIPLLDDGMGGYYFVVAPRRSKQPGNDLHGQVIFWSPSDCDSEEVKSTASSRSLNHL